MTAVTLTIAIGLTLRVLVPLAVVLSVGTLVQALLDRRQEVMQ